MQRGERPPSPLQGVSRAIKSAYAYHARKKAEEQADLPSTHEGDEVIAGRPSHSLLPAIDVIGKRVQDRADKGLGTATDGRRRRAATRIQAVWRGHAVRQWESAEVVPTLFSYTDAFQNASSSFAIFIIFMHKIQFKVSRFINNRRQVRCDGSP